MLFQSFTLFSVFIILSTFCILYLAMSLYCCCSNVVSQRSFYLCYAMIKHFKTFILLTVNLVFKSKFHLFMATCVPQFQGQMQSQEDRPTDLAKRKQCKTKKSKCQGILLDVKNLKRTGYILLEFKIRKLSVLQTPYFTSKDLNRRQKIIKAPKK